MITKTQMKKMIAAYKQEPFHTFVAWSDTVDEIEKIYLKNYHPPDMHSEMM